MPALRRISPDCGRRDRQAEFGFLAVDPAVSPQRILLRQPDDDAGDAGYGLRLPSLADFPKGSCGDASELLGQYLSDSGLGTWGYRSGMQLDPVFSHAWVERDGLIVDITADQFPDVSEPVLLTTDRTWHYARFPPIPGHDAASLDWFKSNDNRAAALSDYEVLKRRADRGRPSYVGSC